MPRQRPMVGITRPLAGGASDGLAEKLHRGRTQVPLLARGCERAIVRCPTRRALLNDDLSEGPP